MTPGKDYTELLTWMQQASAPMIAKLQSLEDKVDKLGQDRATRTDIEKLRAELLGTMVPRDAYEPRHQALIARDTQLETMLREMRKDAQDEAKELHSEISQDLQKIHERMESGKQQFEDRFKLQEERFEERLKQHQDAQLSSRDRAWLRFSQIVSVLAIIGTILDVILQHVKFS